MTEKPSWNSGYCTDHSVNMLVGNSSSWPGTYSCLVRCRGRIGMLTPWWFDRSMVHGMLDAGHSISHLSEVDESDHPLPQYL